MKTFLFFVTLLLAGCSLTQEEAQPQPQIQSRYPQLHKLTIDPFCDGGLTCRRGVFTTFKANYVETLTISGFLPEGVNVCDVHITGWNPTIEIDEGYFYAYGQNVAFTVITLRVEYDTETLPLNEQGLMDFGHWQTHFNQLEFPDEYDLAADCE